MEKKHQSYPVWFVISTTLCHMPHIINVFKTEEEAVLWAENNDSKPQGRVSVIVAKAIITNNIWGRIFLPCYNSFCNE